MGINYRNAVLPIIGINIAVFVLQLVLGTQFTNSFMLVQSDVFQRPWILITSMFLHGSPMHLIFNLYVLLIFGPLIEQRIGTKRFLIIYFLAGFIASIASASFYPASLGASGAIMGILGVTIVLMPDLKILFFFVIPMSLRTAGIIFALIDIIGFFNPTGNVANAAHLAGLACGLLYGWYLLRKKKMHNRRYVHVVQDKHSDRVKKKGKNKNIHMSDDEIDSYMKYGRI